MEREGRREGQAFSSRTFVQGRSAKLSARLADRPSGRHSDKKVIRTTCHLALRQTWEPKWKQCLDDAGGGVMNWEIGVDIYTLICIKWITNKNLLYKKINKIQKFKKNKKDKLLFAVPLHFKIHPSGFLPSDGWMD